MTKIFFGADHAGVELKSELIKELMNSHWLADFKRDVIDLGPQSLDSVDFPDYADLVCKKIHGFSLVQETTPLSMPAEVGILICGSGQGMAMRANKFPHIRAALCWSPEVARLSREHNDANVLCLGSRVTDSETCKQIVQLFLTTPFAGGRHARRVAKVSTPV
jgi:ribose 5-phosphate isomerase B